MVNLSNGWRRFLVSRVIDYLVSNPKKNLPRALNIAKVLAFGDQKKTVQNVIDMYNNPDHACPKYFEKIFSNINRNFIIKAFTNFLVNATWDGDRKRKQIEEKEGIHVPYFLLIDPTERCNLKCDGCWAGNYEQAATMDKELFSSILDQARDLGIYFITISGGEPFMYPYLLDVLEEKSDMVFQIYTNGTFFNEEIVKRIANMGNIFPAISIEGFEDRTDARRGKGIFKKVMQNIDNLRQWKVPFGFSVTVTRENVDEVSSEEFVDFMDKKGAFLCWYFMYVPIGRNPNFEMMLTPEQRKEFFDKISYYRRVKPIVLADFWNDGEAVSGCISSGRKYLHINAKGDVEPCAFVHFAVDNIKEKSLKECLNSDFLRFLQSKIPFSENLRRPCMIIDNPWVLREAVQKYNARPTCGKADDILDELKESIDNYAYSWQKVADKIWYEKKTTDKDKELVTSVKN
ncbi:MAG: radical SAM protein [Caldisericia bacterium]|nr:radical SAM protein [Caldisericia bacterium]HOW02554.1 radical SAM protein [Caldisericia bacterium]